MEKVPSTIITCCILQNICLEVTDTIEVDITNDENENHVASLPGHDVNADGATLRNIIKDMLYYSNCFTSTDLNLCRQNNNNEKSSA